MTSIDCLLFDAYGTLFDVHAATRALWDRLGSKGRALSETWRRRQIEYTWLRAAMNRYAPFWQVTEEALDFALAAEGIDDDLLRADLLAAYRHPPLFDDVVEVLDRIEARGLRRGIFSNAEPDMLRDALSAREIEARFDPVVSADEVKTFKPMARAYAHAIQRAGAKPSRIVFVTANAWDAAGASSAGLTVAWCNRARAPRERLPGEPAHEMNGLRQVAALVAA